MFLDVFDIIFWLLFSQPLCWEARLLLGHNNTDQTENDIQSKNCEHEVYESWGSLGSSWDVNNEFCEWKAHYNEEEEGNLVDVVQSNVVELVIRLDEGHNHVVGECDAEQCNQLEDRFIV